MRSINIKTIQYHVIVINCGDPGAVPNADRSGSEFTYLHNVTYTCHHGYRMTGSPICMCQADGQWSVAPTCQRNYLIFYNNSKFISLQQIMHVNYIQLITMCKLQ